jgi:hypothetical protein
MIDGDQEWRAEHPILRFSFEHPLFRAACAGLAGLRPVNEPPRWLVFFARGVHRFRWSFREDCRSRRTVPGSG